LSFSPLSSNEFVKFPAVGRGWEESSNANYRARQILYGRCGMWKGFYNLVWRLVGTKDYCILSNLN